MAPYVPFPSFPSSSKDTSGHDHDFDFEHVLNLPAFSPSSVESPLASSPEFDSASSHSRHFSPEFDLHSLSGAEDQDVWQGILRGPVWPATNGGSSTSTASFSPQTPLNTFAPSPAPAPASTLPSFFFPATPNPAPTPSAAPQPSSALLDALMTYNAQYGTLLPPAIDSEGNLAAESSNKAASAHGSEGTNDDAHYSAEGEGEHDEEEDEDTVAYRDMFGSSYNAMAGPSSSSASQYGAGSLGAPRRTMGGQVMSSVVVEEGEERMEGDEWRPTPEEYKKLSSKEKRQLRNKISARNFRVRRKNQISTLESRLNDRERIIGAVRDELGSAKLENAELRREIQALKNAVFGGSQTPSFNSNTISPAQLDAPAAAAAGSSTRPASPVPQVNRSKDVSASSAGFWAGQNSSPFGAGSFNTSVHAFTTPDLIFPSSSTLAGKQSPQPNLNPLFNSGGSFLTPPNFKPALPTATTQDGTFEDFVSATPYNLRHATVEAYRNQLWTRLAREAAYAKASTNGADALASGLKPKFYSSPTTTSNSFLTGSSSKLLSGSSAHHSPSMSTPTPPSTTPESSSASTPEDTSHLAFLANIATQSITSRLSAAFVEAFTTPAPSFASLGAATKPARSLDADKIASVLSGRSVLQIVPVTPTPAPTPSATAPAPAPAATASTSSSDSASALERALASLSLGGCSSSSSNAPRRSLKNLLGCRARACASSGSSSSE